MYQIITAGREPAAEPSSRPGPSDDDVIDAEFTTHE